MTEFALIVGLGNPGTRYEHNRHNIGFQTVDTLAQITGISFTRTEHRTQTAHGPWGIHRVLLGKPQTWMNESGKAVAPLARFYKVEPERILVIYDDLDIPLGTLRYRSEGSSGGHRGVQSIIQHLGTQTFPRLRLGIGRPPGRMDPAAYVLQNFNEDESLLARDVIREACNLIRNWLESVHPDNKAANSDFSRAGMTWRLENNDNITARPA
ncbi:MAG: aminoacyl-tRNA hydrolase [Anaerolineae bacterium]|nr:aminoacyl-tRNA hydrolase [Anaerolineae bacterium]